MRHVFIACCCAALTSALALWPQSTSLQKRHMALQGGGHTDDLLRTVDSRALLRELARRGIQVDAEATLRPPMGDADSDKPRQSHVVGDLRPKDATSDDRAAALDVALKAIGIAQGGAALLAGPPLKAYNAFVRPRDPSTLATQSVEVRQSLDFGFMTTCRQQNAAHQIGFLQRHELTRRETYFRNTDAAAKARQAAGLQPHDISIVLDNVRSAENVGSIYRTADCARCKQIFTCGFTPNPISTAKIAKTAFGAETAVASKHFNSTLDALRQLKSQGSCTIWALETVDGSKAYTDAPLPPFGQGGIALLFGNEVTGVNPELLSAVDAVVEIPTYGTKNSMNVACCAATVIFDILRRWEKH